MSHALARILLTCALGAALGAQAQAPERDHERARHARTSGAYVPLQTILDDAQQREPGRIVDVELDDEDDEYEIEILRDDGVVIELEYDARTGALKSREIEDDD